MAPSTKDARRTRVLGVNESAKLIDIRNVKIDPAVKTITLGRSGNFLHNDKFKLNEVTAISENSSPR